MKRITAFFAAALLLALAGYFVLRDDVGPTSPSAAQPAATATVSVVPSAGPVRELRKVKLRLSWVHDLAYAGIYLAKDKGYFEQEGLDVTLQPGGFGMDPIKLVASGSEEFGMTGAGNLLLARAQGIPIVAIGAYFQNDGIGYMTRKDSGITSFKQFKGKRVGVQTGGDTDTLYRALLKLNGMTPKDVKEVPIQYDLATFLSNQIDVQPGYVTNQPITLAGKGVETNVITAASEGVKFYGSVFFSNEQLIQEDPETVARFMRALQRGWKLFFESKDEAVAVSRKWAPEFDPKDLPKIYDAAMPLIKGDTPGLPINGMEMERWQSTEKVLRDAGLLKQDADLSKAFTTRFVK